MTEHGRAAPIGPDQLRAAEALDEHIGPPNGSIFLAAFKVFPDFEILKKTSLHFVPDLDRFAGGINGQGEPSVHLGMAGDVVAPRLKARIIKRFDLPESLRNAPPALFRLFVLAHELGHVIQEDPKFTERFGKIDMTTFSPETDYAAYIESDREANADFIAAMLIGESEIGQQGVFSPPHEFPIQWREWAQEHRALLPS